MGPKQRQQQSPPRKEEPKTAAKPSAPPPVFHPSSSEGKRSIGTRKTDCFFVITYLAWSFVAFVLFLANCTQLLPHDIQGVEFANPVCGSLKTLEGPLRPFVESQEQWGEKLFNVKGDFALKLVHYNHVFFVAPVALLLAIGFLAGAGSVKNIALVHAAVVLYNMVIVDLHAYEVLRKLDVLNLETAALGAFIVYGFCTIFPLVVMKRVWSSAPFHGPDVKRGFLIRFVFFWGKFALFCWLVAAAVGIYEFSVKNTRSLKNLPSVVDAGVEGWVKATPWREQAMVKAAEFQVYAGQKVVDAAVITQDMLTALGQKILAKVNEWQAAKAEPKAAEDSQPKRDVAAKPKKEAAAAKPSPPPPSQKAQG